MDQLKEFLGLFRRQHFWFVLPVVLILSIVGWKMATGNVDEVVKTQTSAINSLFSQASGVQSTIVDENGHPNQGWHEGQDELNRQRMENVKEAWKRKYDRQANVLEWPEGYPFSRFVKGVRNFESLDPKSIGWNPYHLTEYRKYVHEQLPALAQTIGAKWAPSSTGINRSNRRNEPSGPQDPSQGDEAFVVDWDSTNQGTIYSKFDWEVPTTEDALYAQEDLWVLSAIMEIIKTTNGNARTRSAAAIKKLVALEFGADMSPPTFQLLKPTAPATGGALSLGDDDDEEDLDLSVSTSATGPEYFPAVDQASDDEMSSDIETHSDFTSDASQNVNKVHPALSGRYVDGDFKPLTASSLSELQNKLDVAKRIPVRLRVEMDQREINRLLVACANSKLTFEVHQFRFNPKDSSSIQFSPRDGGRGIESGNAIGARNTTAISSFVRPVEIYGIIYIFNPVNEKLLGSSEASDVLDAI